MADSFAEIDRLISEDKMQAALAVAERLHASARAEGDVDAWTRALIRRVQLETALSGFQKAVEILRAEPWPDDPTAHVALELVYATALTTYEQQYSWEVRQRERVVADDTVDLERWTSQQIRAAADAAFARLWIARDSWGDRGLTRLAEYVQPNTYPGRIRGTLRDAVSYLWIELLADSGAWRADQQATWELDLEALLAGAPALDPATPELHPLARLAAVLGDLERWHAAHDRPEAALEAFLERSRRLRASFTQADDAATIREALRRRVDATPRALPWWSSAMAELAEVVRGEDTPDALVRARKLAVEGERAHPGSPGAQRCRHLIAAIEAPSYSLQAMASDARGKPSIAIEHANLASLHFRAIRLDPEQLMTKADDWSWLPNWQQAQQLVRDGKPAATWIVELPPTPDYRTHRTLITPQIRDTGLWLVAASARADFRDEVNQLTAVAMLLGDPVLLVGHGSDRTDWEVAVRSGATGAPLAGAEVSVIRLDWQKGHRVVRRTTTGTDGTVTLPAGDWDRQYMVLARAGGELAVDFQQLHRLWSQPVRPDRGVLVYTDRAVYRPGQSILWKVVAWDRDSVAGRIAVAPETSIEVTLRDANGEDVDQATVTTNRWGSASGTFTATTGRLLGGWSIQTSNGGYADVRVEEYKRPTFEVTLEEPKEPLRLNRDARLTGEARYYFGLPVSDGSVRYRVTREVVPPPWYCWWWWWNPPPAGGPEVIAAGTTRLDADGRFEVPFVPRADERLAGGDGKSKSALSWRFRVHAKVTDPGGETGDAERGVRLGFVTVETRLDAGGDFLSAGTGLDVEAMRTDLDAVPRAGVGRWQLLRVVQPAQAPLPADVPRRAETAPGAYATPDDARRARWEGETRPEAIVAGWADGAEIATGTVEHGADGRGRIALPKLSPGVYRLRYTTDDPFGATFEVARELVVAAPPAESFAAAARPEGEPLRLPLVLGLERASVEVGETLRLLVASGLDGAPLRLELFRAGARRWQRDLPAGTQVVELPIGSDDRGGFSLRLLALRDHQLMQIERHVTVPWSDRQLEVRFATFRDRLRPGSRESWRVEVKDPAPGGELVEAELLASMYDRSLDRIAPYDPPRPLELFPSWFGVADLHASLGVARTLWRGGRGLASLPGYPSFAGDRVIVLDRYGIGGPGVRRGLAKLAMAREMVAAAPPPAPQAAPTSVDEVITVSAEAPLLDASATTVSAATSDREARAASEPTAAEPSVELRTDFAETALWAPHLVLGEDGSAAIEVELPDSVTEWSVWVHALTRDFQAGAINQRARTVKDLQVRPSLPRFLREGDRLTVEVLVDNAGEAALDATVRFDLEDATSGESLAAAFGIAPETVAGRVVHVEPGRTVGVPVELTVPARLGTVAIRATARAGELSDGELRPLPVLPGRMHLSQSRFAALRDQAHRTLRFADLAADDDPSRIDEQLVVTVDAQLMTTVLRALPYLVDYPYECTEQTLNRFLSTGIVTRVFANHPALAALGKRLAAERDTLWEGFDAADPNRRMELEETPWLRESRGGPREGEDIALLRVLDPEVAAAQRRDALAKLLAAQTSSGGFPWFPGGPPSPWITLYLVDGFSRALEFGVEVPREPLVRAWGYLHRYWVDDLVREAIAHDCCWETVTYLGYVLSNFPDESFTGGVFSADDRRTMLDFGWKHWRQHAPRLKAYLALTLHRAGRAADARLVLDSILDSATTDEDLGTYWAREEQSWLWYRDTVESHAFILRTISELLPDDPRRDGLIQWLLLEKKLSHWKSTRATAEAIYSLAWALERSGRLGVREVIEVAAGPRETTFTFEPDDPATRRQLVIAGEDVTPAMGAIEVRKDTPGFAFATATWHFSTERLPAQGDGDLFAVERRYFKRELTGSEWTLTPLADGTALAPGDEVEVQLEVRARHGAEYVHLRDPRPAGFEPDAVRSGWKWDLGLAWYEEVRDSGINFFFEALPTGTYTLKHRLKVRQAGVFRVAPATLQSMYAPEHTAHSAGHVVRVDGEEP